MNECVYCLGEISILAIQNRNTDRLYCKRIPIRVTVLRTHYRTDIKADMGFLHIFTLAL